LLGPTDCGTGTEEVATPLAATGGASGFLFSPENLKELEPPKMVVDLRDLLAQSTVDVRAVANSISYLGTGFLRNPRADRIV